MKRLSILGLLLLICIGIYVVIVYKPSDDVAKIDGTKTGTVKVNSSDKDTVCFDSATYFVVQKNNKDEVGSDILVKYKVSTNQVIQCNYVPTKNDFEIKNESAEYFLLLTDNFIVLDSGTGPNPRMIIVYDLSKRIKVYEDNYSRPITNNGNILDYWRESNTKATSSNCANFYVYEKDSLLPTIENRVKLDLSTLAKVSSDEVRCVAYQ